MNDDELREHLSSLDPASHLPAADTAEVARLLEDTMDDERNDERNDERTGHTRGRSPLAWLVAAAAVVVLIGGGIVLVTGQGDDADTDAALSPASQSAVSGSSGTGGAADTVTELTTDGGAPASRCLPPEAAPQVVAAQTTVFDGVVESISGSVVTLRASRFYAGDPTDLVTVTAPSDDMQALLSAVTFEEGKRYLVAATDAQVTFCGFSAAYSDSLAKVYATAFPG